jgi:RNA polymerase sigma factor (sigma-70 family)
MDSDKVIELVQSARAGDGAAWNAIVDEYASVVWSVIRGFRLAEPAALDAAQTTWLRLIEHLDAIKNPACVPGWLKTTARRTCLEQLRESSREFAVDPYDDHRLHRAVASDQDSPEHDLLRHEDVRLVRAALATLEERDQVLLTLLTAPERISYHEIGARLGIPIGSIGPTRGRALARLRAALTELGVTEMAGG